MKWLKWLFGEPGSPMELVTIEGGNLTGWKDLAKHRPGHFRQQINHDFPWPKKTSRVAVALGKSQSWFKHVFSDFHSELLSSEAAHWNKHGSQVEGATVQYVRTYFIHSDNVSSNKHPLRRWCAFDYNHVSFVERNEQMFSANVWVQE